MTRRTSGDEQIVGIGIWRDFARISQRDTWPVYRGSRSTIISQLGTLTGLRGVGSGHRVELIPYTVTRNVTQRSATGWVIRSSSPTAQTCASGSARHSPSTRR